MLADPVYRRSGHKSLAEHLLSLSRDPDISSRATALCECSISGQDAKAERLGPASLAQLLRRLLGEAEGKPRRSDSIVLDLHATDAELGTYTHTCIRYHWPV